MKLEFNLITILVGKQYFDLSSMPFEVGNKVRFTQECKTILMTSDNKEHIITELRKSRDVGHYTVELDGVSTYDCAWLMPILVYKKL